MAFTTRTIIHTFTNADGTAGSGTVKFTLTKMMTNDGTSIVPASITSALDGSGQLSQSVTCTNDADTVPTDAQWRVDFEILGAENQSYFIVVPSGIGTVDLGTLLPSAQQVT